MWQGQSQLLYTKISGLLITDCICNLENTNRQSSLDRLRFNDICPIRVSPAKKVPKSLFYTATIMSHFEPQVSLLEHHIALSWQRSQLSETVPPEVAERLVRPGEEGRYLGHEFSRYPTASLTCAWIEKPATSPAR
jgi:hypothetical protein